MPPQLPGCVFPLGIWIVTSTLGGAGRVFVYALVVPAVRASPQIRHLSMPPQLLAAFFRLASGLLLVP